MMSAETQIQVKAIGREYSAQILAIFNEVIANETAMYEYEPRTLAMMEQWFDDKEKNNWPIVGVVDWLSSAKRHS
jgi:L-amino acid N-acyltransferase YncA